MSTHLLRTMRGLLATLLVAVSLPASVAAQANPNFEYGIDRAGGDYRSFDLSFDAPGLCAGQCAQERQCRSWTYVRPGVQGPKARCWLKNVVPAPTRNTNTISGLRGPAAPVAAAPVPVRPVPVGAPAYVGCFRDTSDFDLKGYLERGRQNTPQRCIATCRARGFAFAGVQYGESCLCGNSHGRYGASTACNYACTGDRTQACGGYNANSVYSTGLAVAAVPPPAAPTTPPAPPAPAGDCWSTSRTFVEVIESGWRAVYTRRGSSNVFDAVYTRGSERGLDVLTLNRIGSHEIRVQRNNYASELGSTIGPDGVARGMYAGGDRFTLTCGG